MQASKVIAFNAVNARSAGTAAVTRLMIDQLRKHKGPRHFRALFLVPEDFEYPSKDHESYRGVEIVRIRFGNGPLRLLRRIIFELFGFPRLSRRFSASIAIILGNYSMRRLSIPKIVLVRHPYLLDLRCDNASLSLRRRIEERLRALAFRLTVRCTNHWIVQSQQMRASLSARWGIDRARIAVLPNPVDNQTLEAKNEQSFHPRKLRTRLQLIYPSRWYEHKNHLSLLRFAQSFAHELREAEVTIFVTIAPVAANRTLLSMLADDDISDLIINLGELSKPDLYRWYKRVDAIIFPSESETFGNGLLEGACFGLPLLVADRPYARAFGEDSVALFEPSDPASMLKALESLKNNYELMVKKSTQIAGLAIDTQTWVTRAVRPHICTNGTISP